MLLGKLERVCKEPKSARLQAFRNHVAVITASVYSSVNGMPRFARTSASSEFLQPDHASHSPHSRLVFHQAISNRIRAYRSGERSRGLIVVPGRYRSGPKTRLSSQIGNRCIEAFVQGLAYKQHSQQALRSYIEVLESVRKCVRQFIGCGERVNAGIHLLPERCRQSGSRGPLAAVRKMSPPNSREPWRKRRRIHPSVA